MNGNHGNGSQAELKRISRITTQEVYKQIKIGGVEQGPDGVWANPRRNNDNSSRGYRSTEHGSW